MITLETKQGAAGVSVGMCVQQRHLHPGNYEEMQRRHALSTEALRKRLAFLSNRDGRCARVYWKENGERQWRITRWGSAEWKYPLTEV